MKIGVISDTHGCAATWSNVYKNYFKDTDIIIHAGDVLYHGPRNSIPEEYNPKQLAELLNACEIPLVIACGNCDAEVDGMVLQWPIQAPYAYVIHNGLRIVVTHGQNLDEDESLEVAKKMQANIFITGHTHEPKLEKIGNIIFLNPGSPAMSKREDKRGTAAVICDREIKLLDVNSGETLMTETL